MAGERGPRWTDPSSDATPLLRELLAREHAAAPSDAALRKLAAKIVESRATADRLRRRRASSPLETLEPRVGRP